jgi:16S rRNA (cytosine1402-N4)-methyltransferase
MRMNRAGGFTAAQLLNNYSEEELHGIFRNYGEVQGFKNLSKLILKRRDQMAFGETADFINAIDPFLPKFKTNKILSKIFQALRIEVNDEMGALTEMLRQLPDVMAPGGRLVVISYQSIEDRIVKNFTKTGNVEGIVNKDFYGNVQTPFRIITKNIIIPDEKEVLENPRSRSAKLRIAEKI